MESPSLPGFYFSKAGKDLCVAISWIKAKPWSGASQAKIYRNVIKHNQQGIWYHFSGCSWGIRFNRCLKSGWSKPITCGHTGETYHTYVDDHWLVINDQIKSHEQPLSFECISQLVTAFGPQTCTQNEDPQYLAHLNAPNIARPGQESKWLWYFGFLWQGLRKHYWNHTCESISRSDMTMVLDS